MTRKGFFIIFSAALVSLLIGCISRRSDENSPVASSDLQERLSEIADSCRGEVGIAFFSSDGDTVLVNDVDMFPLMSVFKLHQAMALCGSGVGLDSVVMIPREVLNENTWSPMLRDFPMADTIAVSIERLMRYAVEQSDNNASNYLFSHVQGIKEVDDYISRLIPDGRFQLVYTEAEMLVNHALAYENHSSPSSVGHLLASLYTDSALIASPSMARLRRSLESCATGEDRIVAPLKEEGGVVVAHKTGSGFKDNGVLAAHNDVAFVRLPAGRYYTLVVLIKDFHGEEKEAAGVIAEISKIVYTYIKQEL